jgi:hypothetical protein
MVARTCQKFFSLQKFPILFFFGLIQQHHIGNRLLENVVKLELGFKKLTFQSFN